MQSQDAQILKKNRRIAELEADIRAKESQYSSANSHLEVIPSKTGLLLNEYENETEGINSKSDQLLSLVNLTQIKESLDLIVEELERSK